MYSLIHDIVIKEANKLNMRGEDIRKIKDIFNNELIFNIKSIYESQFINVDTINMNEDLRVLLIKLYSLKYDFDLIHFLTVLSNHVDFNNINPLIKQSFIINYYEKEDSVLKNQLVYYNLCKDLLNDDSVNDVITINEYSALLLYDPKLVNELFNLSNNK